MKSPLAQILQNLHTPARQRLLESQFKKVQTQNVSLEKTLKDKERELDRLKNELNNLEAKIQELNGTDILTKLPNRFVFKEHLSESLKRAIRVGYSLSILLIDIDNLNEINLKYGFELGDTVIIEVAKIVKASVREIDLPARWGGEELVVVLHETDVEGASHVAKRILKNINNLDITDLKDNSAIKVSATIAISSCPQHSSDVSHLIEITSQALLSAKEAGGNQVITAKC